MRARVTAGLATPDAPRLDRTLAYRQYQPEVLRFLEVVARVGATAVTLVPRLALTGKDHAAARRLAGDGTPLVTVHPGAGDPRRRWPARDFARVADALADAEARIVIVGGGSERALATETAAHMRAPAAVCAGELDLPGLVEVLAASSLVVGNDSGPVHLAEALGSPTVGVYWGANLLTAGPTTRDRHRAAASWRTACPVCGVDCTTGDCPHDASFVADVPVDEVLQEALDLLGLLATSPTAASATSTGSTSRHSWA
jgi:ADP-heptose:LPS heptosyltransferase